jgi:hypothetical protein
MSEDEWLGSADPQAMLSFLHDSGKLSERKARLFAVACCRRIWHLLGERPARGAVEVAERYADGAASPEELEAAALPLRWHPGTSLNKSAKNTDAAALWAAWGAWFGWSDLPDAVNRSVGYAARARGTGGGQRAAQAALLRDLWGNPFRPVALDPAWLAWNSGTVRRLAEAAYQDRVLPDGTLLPDRLAVLADALEEAGCGEVALLDHLRGPGPHVRGCWAVDLLLGKS